MKPFDLELALEGHKVVTRFGCPVDQIVHFKTLSPKKHSVYGVTNGGLECWREDGRYSSCTIESPMDLFMAPIKREVWTNVYKAKGGFWTMVAQYDSEKEARSNFPDELGEYIKSIKIHEYEE